MIFAHGPWYPEWHHLLIGLGLYTAGYVGVLIVYKRKMKRK